MASEKIETEFKNPIKYPLYTKNMFTKALGDKYAKKFHEVYYANFGERDKLMKELYEDSKQDNTLKDFQVSMISKCYVAYLAAVGANCNISLPIISYVDKKKPNLTKILHNEVRLKRIAIDLQESVDRTGFVFDIYNLPDLINVFLTQFSQDDKLEDSELSLEYIVLAALGKYIRLLPIIALPNIWYAIMFMKNIASLAYITSEEYKENEHIKPQVLSIVKTIYAINIMELKRTNKPVKLKEKEESKAENITASEDDKNEEASHDI